MAADPHHSIYPARITIIQFTELFFTALPPLFFVLHKGDEMRSLHAPTLPPPVHQIYDDILTSENSPPLFLFLFFFSRPCCPLRALDAFFLVLACPAEEEHTPRSQTWWQGLAILPLLPISVLSPEQPAG